MRNKLDKIFALKQNNTTITREIIAGATTFAAMSYVLVANSGILAACGMDKASLVTVTALAAAIGCFLMAFISNFPIAAAPSMGSNAFFAFVVCLSMGLKWQEALSLVFYNGILFLILSLTGLREKLIKAVPSVLQVGLQAGIGLFIAFFGLQEASLIVSDPNTMLAFTGLSDPKTVFSLAGIILMSILFVRKSKMAILLSIIIMSVVGLFVECGDGGTISTAPSSIFSLPASISSTFFQLDFMYPFHNITKAMPIIITLLILDTFDTLATVIAMGRVSGLMDNASNFPKVGKAFIADSLATIFGAILGTSTTGAYVESATGIKAGGRTGLTSLVVGVFFLLSLFFSPIINMIPSEAVAPALIIVGILMLDGINDLDFTDFAKFIPAVFCMLMVAFSFNIAIGFVFGLISYVILMVFTNRASQVNIFTWSLALLMTAFLIYS